MKKLLLFLLLIPICALGFEDSFIDSSDYTFDASARTLTTTRVDNEFVVRIVNITDDVVIYQIGDPDRGGSETSNVVTLNFNTTRMSDGDSLLIVYESLRTGDFKQDVCQGLVGGYNCINKFGENIEIDNNMTADIWDGGHTLASSGVSLLWVAPTAARIHTIASTDANDTDAGTGAQEVRIYGLSDWDTSETIQVVTMNTASPPTTTSMVIIYRMEVVTKGSAGVNLGTITATAAVDSTVTAQIRIGQGQTQMLIYAIPSIEKLFISDLGMIVNKAAGATGLIDCSLLVNPEPDVQLTHFLYKQHIGLQTVGNSGFVLPFNVPEMIVGPALLKVQCDSGTDNMHMSAWLNGIRVAN